jgi:stage II sporulation protein D
MAFDSDQPTIRTTATPASNRGAFTVPTTMARVLLKDAVSSAVLYSLDTVAIHAARVKGHRRRARGRIAIAGDRGARSVTLRFSSGAVLSASLPCTLLARSAHNYFELEDASYRGSIILAPGTDAAISLINFIDIEAYLRGVVPLEIGRRPREQIEAVKAQAVAARTYAYRRILERRHAPYDLLSTVADQVYGGVNVEEPLSDQAISQTRDIVLVHADSLIVAYYHSTCGGRTANVEDVWDKPASPYLRSVADTAPDGRAYCAISRYFTWEEQWATGRFSDIVGRYAAGAFPAERPVKGVVRAIEVDRRFACGRVARCTISTTRGRFGYGGDRVRFLMRRDIKGRPILRSASFEVVATRRGTVRLKGRGYGHGVGMCQMGAIGRARAGRSFDEILSAYYTDARLQRVDTGRY